MADNGWTSLPVIRKTTLWQAITPECYDEMVENLRELEEMEITFKLQEAEAALARGETISHEEVKKRLNFPKNKK